VNGRAVESLPAFASELDRAGIGQAVELTLNKDGKERRVKVQVIDVQP
jgi:S1-C subfamily serine protease